VAALAPPIRDWTQALSGVGAGLVVFLAVLPDVGAGGGGGGERLSKTLRGKPTRRARRCGRRGGGVARRLKTLVQQATYHREGARVARAKASDKGPKDARCVCVGGETLGPRVCITVFYVSLSLSLSRAHALARSLSACVFYRMEVPASARHFTRNTHDHQYDYLCLLLV